MKTTRLSIAAVLMLGLASCVSPIERRVTRNPEMFSKLPAAEQTSVRRGEVREGMSKDAVFLAWGQPDRVAKGRRDGKNRERWSYTQYEQVQHFGYGGGLGFAGGGWYDPIGYAGPIIDYVPVPGRSVEFVEGKVAGFLVPR